jgi:hypothetical protein
VSSIIFTGLLGMFGSFADQGSSSPPTRWPWPDPSKLDAQGLPIEFRRHQVGQPFNATVEEQCGGVDANAGGGLTTLMTVGSDASISMASARIDSPRRSHARRRFAPSSSSAPETGAGESLVSFKARGIHFIFS